MLLVCFMLLVSHVERTIHIFFGDGSCNHNSAYCNFRRRTCILICGLFYMMRREQFTNILLTRAVCNSLRKEIFAMQVCIAVKVSQYIPQDGFLNSAPWSLCHNSTLLYQYHNSIRVTEWANQKLMMTSHKEIFYSTKIHVNCLLLILWKELNK